VPGKDSVELTIVPAAVAGAAADLGVLVALIPPDLGGGRAASCTASAARRSRHVAKVPAIAGEGFGFAVGSSPTPRAAGWRWSARPASGRPTSASSGRPSSAFGVHVPLAVVVQGFFLGMVANLFPLAPAGVGRSTPG
jgi:hypothetical protein